MIPLKESDTAHSQHAEARPASVQSPGLSQFRQNPFRVLRLPVAATSTQAVWKAEKVLTLVRAGMRLPGDDPLPWLAEADEIEIQEAAQKMEEPLRRLAEQLFWFDFDTDPAGDLLSRALRGDATALSDALAIPEPKAPTRGNEPQPQHDAASVPAPLEKEQAAILIERINQANLRLIAALAAMHGTGPQLAAQGPASREKTGTSLETRWTEVNGMQVIVNAHESVTKQREDGVRAYEKLLGEALSRWAAIVADADFPAFLRCLIDRLDDDLVTDEDTEPLMHAISTLLADILAGEIKACTLAGRMDRTATLARIAGECGLDAHVWIQKLKPLRYLFRSEVDDLATLIVEPAPASIENLQLYLERMAVLRDQWRALDAANLLGLAQTIDDGVLIVHDRIQAIQENVSVEEQLAESENLRKLLFAAAEVAHANSVKERLRTAAGWIERAREDACHYCRKREASDFPTVLEGRKVLSHDNDIIHYRVRWTFVPRCTRCADFHEFLNDVWWYVMIAYLITCLIAIVIAGWTDLTMLVIGGIAALTVNLMVGLPVGLIGEWIASLVLTPRGDRRYENVHASSAWKDLRSDGYSLTMTYTRKNAYTRVQAKAQEQS